MADGHDPIQIPAAVWTKLDLIIAEVSKTNVRLEHLDGKHNLQAQILQFTAEALKAEKTEREASDAKQSARIEVLEKWRWGILGAAAALSLVMPFLKDGIVSQFGTGKSNAQVQPEIPHSAQHLSR